MNTSAVAAHGFLDNVRADLYRHYERFSWPLLLRAILFKRTFTPVFTLRLCQLLDRPGLVRPLHVLARGLHRWATARAAIDLPWQTSIGPGFRIVHGFGLVVNARARLGSNVTVFQGATIGQRDRWEDGAAASDYPAIGDEVFVGAYAMVLGVTVGRGSTIAPLSVVVDPVADSVVVSGNPARVIRTGSRPYVTKTSRGFGPGAPARAGGSHQETITRQNLSGRRS
jgi:serine O-acetyltransferase